jgi:hypothetical protein
MNERALLEQTRTVLEQMKEETFLHGRLSGRSQRSGEDLLQQIQVHLSTEPAEVTRVSNTLYQGQQITLATAARKCDRCAKRRECFYVVGHISGYDPSFGQTQTLLELSLCLEDCWPDFLAALNIRSEMP